MVRTLVFLVADSKVFMYAESARSKTPGLLESCRNLFEADDPAKKAKKKQRTDDGVATTDAAPVAAVGAWGAPSGTHALTTLKGVTTDDMEEATACVRQYLCQEGTKVVYAARRADQNTQQLATAAAAMVTKATIVAGKSAAMALAAPWLKLAAFVSAARAVGTVSAVGDRSG